MPPGVNHAAFASAGAIAASLAIAAAIAIYESPELRRYTDDVRRRVAIALHSIGEGIQPPQRAPMFNRPEDAQGFYESRRGTSVDPGVDADEESCRRQREELLYWNALHLERQAQEKKRKEVEGAQGGATSQLPDATRGPSFDDFMQQDGNAGRGSFVYNSGSDARNIQDGLLRRRHDTAQSINPAVYANPFADENQIDRDELPVHELSGETTDVSPDQREIMSDIYSATTQDPQEVRRPDSPATLSAATPPLVDISNEDASQGERSVTLDNELGRDEYVTAGQEDRTSHEAYASIQAWAQGAQSSSHTDFYSPLPMSPAAPISEPEMVSEGVLTPTDSVSLVGSGEDVANDAASSRAGENGRPYDVLSESEGMLTPASWSEVGSVLSESDAPVPAPARAMP